MPPPSTGRSVRTPTAAGGDDELTVLVAVLGDVLAEAELPGAPALLLPGGPGLDVAVSTSPARSGRWYS